MRRRFTLGTFFFDLPTAEEREVIWQIYLRKFGVDGELPEDAGWTGAEIKECCRKSSRLKISLREAANVHCAGIAQRGGADQVVTNPQASGKFISASFPGVYEYGDEPTPANRGRRIIRMTSYDVPKEVN